MLESVKISRRQSEIRQTLSGLVGKPEPSEDETRQMESMDAEYQRNETRYRAALIAETEEREKATGEFETRSDRDYADLVGRFELRQVALLFDENRALDGATAEVVQEMRSHGSYRGVPVPWMALERRVGETIASDTPDPLQTRPLIDRLFPQSVAGRMGAQMISIDHGLVEWPVVTSSVAAGWADGELAAVPGPTAFKTTDKPMAPNQNLGVQMKISRRTLKQSGNALEAAVRRDMSSAIEQELDKAVFLGTGANGQPLGVIAGAGTYGITSTAVGAAASWAVFRAAIVRFMLGNAASGPSGVRLLIRPEIYDFMDGDLFDAGSGITEWDKLLQNISSPVMTTNALAAPAGGPPTVSNALLTTSAGGVSPVFVGLWGGVDLIRDVFSDAASGGLRLTGLVTADVTVARPGQLELLTGVANA